MLVNKSYVQPSTGLAKLEFGNDRGLIFSRGIGGITNLPSLLLVARTQIQFSPQTTQLGWSLAMSS